MRNIIYTCFIFLTVTANTGVVANEKVNCSDSVKNGAIKYGENDSYYESLFSRLKNNINDEEAYQELHCLAKSGYTWGNALFEAMQILKENKGAAMYCGVVLENASLSDQDARLIYHLGKVNKLLYLSQEFTSDLDFIAKEWLQSSVPRNYISAAKICFYAVYQKNIKVNFYSSVYVGLNKLVDEGFVDAEPYLDMLIKVMGEREMDKARDQLNKDKAKVTESEWGEKSCMGFPECKDDLKSNQ